MSDRPPEQVIREAIRSRRPYAYDAEVALAALLSRLEQAKQREAKLRTGLLTAKLHSLLEVRRAAFTPAIGTRYTEVIRLSIADACRGLEDALGAALAASPEGE